MGDVQCIPLQLIMTFIVTLISLQKAKNFTIKMRSPLQTNTHAHTDDSCSPDGLSMRSLVHA